MYTTRDDGVRASTAKPTLLLLQLDDSRRREKREREEGGCIDSTGVIVAGVDTRRNGPETRGFSRLLESSIDSHSYPPRLVSHSLIS